MYHYLFSSNLHHFITGGSTPIGLSEREVEWPGDAITPRKNRLNVPEKRTKVRHNETLHRTINKDNRKYDYLTPYNEDGAAYLYAPQKGFASILSQLKNVSSHKVVYVHIYMCIFLHIENFQPKLCHLVTTMEVYHS